MCSVDHLNHIWPLNINIYKGFIKPKPGPLMAGLQRLIQTATWVPRKLFP